ncbi:MAG: VOC family protein [Gammaproteobacteria bacterium]
MNYFVFGTNNKKSAIAFYDALFDGHDINRIYSEGRMTLWAGDDFLFGIAEPYDGNPASNGNGTMLGFNVGSSDAVENLYHKAIALGGVDEGEPGLRSGRFSAYFRDLDSNKICLFE